MNNKVCSSCGAVNNINAKFCTNCGVSFNQQNMSYQQNMPYPQNFPVNNVSPYVNNVTDSQNNSSSDGTIYGVLSLILYFAGSIIIFIVSSFLPDGEFNNYFSSLSGMCPLAGIVTMIIGRIKYPKNKFLKVVMWVIIVSIILAILAFILFVIWCYVTCSNMNTSGCS